MQILYIAIAAFCGGIISALLGWLDGGQEFNARKFASSALRALIAAIIFAIAYNFAESFGWYDILAAIAGGAGVDVIGNRAAGAIRSATRK